MEGDGVWKRFDDEFPPFRGVGARFPIFNETPNRDWIKQFFMREIEAAKREAVREVAKKIWGEGLAVDHDSTVSLGHYGNIEAQQSNVFPKWQVELAKLGYSLDATDSEGGDKASINKQS